MLTKVTAYSQWADVDPLVLNVINRPETDRFEVRNIDGLTPVKAAVNTTPMGSIRGASFSGTSVAERNLVFTLGLDPDWDEWTVSRLRRLLDKFFMPEQSVRFVFETMEFSPVEISGYVESNEPNMFSKDPEQVISVICPKPDFITVDPFVIEGNDTMDLVEFNYGGSVETGIVVKVESNSASNPEDIGVYVQGPYFTYLHETQDELNPLIDATKYFQMSSVAGEKYVRNYPIPSGPAPTNIRSKVMEGSRWPKLVPGQNGFQLLLGSGGSADWTLTYFEKFGSL